MSRLPRRRFLEESLLAASAAAGLTSWNRAFAQTRSTPKKSANERLTVCVVGIRGRGSDHLNAFIQRPDTEVAYLVDPDESIGQQRVKQVADKQGSAPKYVRDIRRALEDPGLDIVTIATPNHWHALAAIWAMQHGKHVYVEKPGSHSLGEALTCVAASRKYNRVGQIGTQCRSTRGTIEAIRFVHDGKIGEVKLARGLCYKRRKSIGPAGNYPIPPEVDYDVWSGPAPILPLTRPQFHYDWHWQRVYGNGDIGNQGPHQMDIARWGLGADRFCDWVISYGGRLGYEDAGDTANTQTAIYGFGDKTLVFEVRGLETQPLRPHPDALGAMIGVIFYGSEGYVVMDSYTHGAAFDLQGRMIAEFRGDGDHYGNFVEAVKASNPELLAADINEGCLSSGLSHLANVSYYLGKPANLDEIRSVLKELKTTEDPLATLDRVVEHLRSSPPPETVDLSKTPLTLGPLLAFDPVACKFPNNPEANRLLRREEYRKPYVIPLPEEV